MQPSDVITFQKALALAASASNPFEAEAAELAVRRIMNARNIDPTRVPDQSFVSRHINFADNPLLRTLREEYRALHPLPVKKPKPDKPIVIGKLEFSIKGYRRVAAKNHKKKRRYSRRDDAQIERVRELLNSGLSWNMAAKRGGFTVNQVAGIVRDMTATMGAGKQRSPRWITELRSGRPYYTLVEHHNDSGDSA